MMVASSLLTLVTEQQMTPAMKLELRSFVLDALFNKGPTMEAWVVTKLNMLFARLTKLGWYEDDRNQDVVEDAMKFVDAGTPAHSHLGYQMLTTLVTDMNTPTKNRALSDHRKTAISFRDLVLLKIFQLAVRSLTHLQSLPQSPPVLVEALLSLSVACLSFDFVGTCFDESGEDMGSIQIPSNWRPLLEATSLIKMLIEIYTQQVSPTSSLAMECLVRIASVRRSLFTGEQQRQAFLSQLVHGTLTIFMTQQGLSDHENYHNFCRLLGRLKTNYQLNEIVAVDCYAEWINFVAQFTIQSLRSWQWASSSVYYLLGLWSRLVSAVPYLKGDKPSRLDQYIPEILQTYVVSRLDSVGAVLQGQTTEDPLESDEQIADQMEALPQLCRFQYDKACDYLLGVLNPLVESYQAMGQSGATADEAALLEGQLTWLCHMVGAIIRGKLSLSTGDSQESLDGALSSLILLLLTSTDTGFHATRYDELSRQRLDVAILVFFQCFRKVYVGDQAMHNSKVYRALKERVGLDDHLAIVQLMLQKIATNLQSYRSSATVISATLELLRDLSDGYMSGKLLLKVQATSAFLENHTDQYFGFLKEPANTRARTLYYATLARILFLDDSPAKFRAFVLPIHRLCLEVNAAGPTALQLRQTVPQNTVVGLFRDLLGIASATNARRTYSQVFDWLYPNRFPTIIRCLEAFVDVPAVTTPLLKFMSEIALNKSQRLAFEASSPSGILLFREISKAVCIFGRHVLAMGDVVDAYAKKYKGIWICLTMLMRALGGNYVNFGVFKLYNDPALTDALQMGLLMAQSIPQKDIIAFRKVSKALYGFLEVFFHSHARVAMAQDAGTYRFLLESLDAGLQSLDVNISSHSAAAVDNLVTNYLGALQADVVDINEVSIPPEVLTLQERMRESPGAFPSILRTLLEHVLLEDVTNQWSLSRPLLPLIILDESSFQDIKEQIVMGQREPFRSALREVLTNLDDGVGRTLESKNRDKITQNLAMLKHQLRSQRSVVPRVTVADMS